MVISQLSNFNRAGTVIVLATGLALVQGSPSIQAETSQEEEECTNETSSAPPVEIETVIDVSVIERENIERLKKVERVSRDFKELAKQWRDERSATSSVAQMAMSSTYQQIIGMGQDAVPMILAKLKSEGNAPDHWFWALASITRDNPVPKTSRGKLQEMAKAWLEWGEKEGYV
jgi:hypothetical protein